MIANLSRESPQPLAIHANAEVENSSNMIYQAIQEVDKQVSEYFRN